MTSQNGYVHRQLDRAIEDTGFLAADGSEAYAVANPGEGITQLVFVHPNINVPKAKRDYDGVEVALEKRMCAGVLSETRKPARP